MTTTSFTAIYNKYYPLTLNWVNQRVHNQVVSEDITIKAFIKISEKLDIYDPNISKITTWIIEIAKNCMIDYFRSKEYKKSTKTTLVSSYVDEEGNETFTFIGYDLASNLVESKELKKQINFALSQLSENQKNCFNLFFVENKKYEEIAEILGLSMANVKVLILRAKAAMQISLKATYESL